MPDAKVEVIGPGRGALRRGHHAGGAGVHRRAAPALQPDAPGAAGGARSNARSASTPARSPTSCPRPSTIRDDPSWRVAPVTTADLQDRRVEITGPTDRRMVINALNCGATRLHGRLRGRQHADLGQHGRRPGQPDRRHQPHDRAYDAGRPRVQAQRRRSRRCWCGRAAGTWTRSTCWSTASRCRAACSTSGSTSSTTPRTLLARGSGPYFYLPKMESHLEARLWNDVFTLRRSDAGRAARHDQGDGADRDDPRRVRDRRDPLRAARPLGRLQRRALGLHLQRDQEVPRTGTCSCPTAARSR